MDYDRLCQLSDVNKWDEFIENLDSKTDDKRIVAKLAAILTKPESNLPLNVISALLKCLANTCAYFKHLNILSEDRVNCKIDNYSYNIYEELSIDSKGQCKLYPRIFPYNGIAEWAIDYLNEHDSEIEEDNIKVLKTCLRFLCNVSTAANDCRIPSLYQNQKLLSSLIKILLYSEDENMLLLTCALVHNIHIHNILFNTAKEPDYSLDLLSMIQGLIRADSLKIHTANDSIMLLLRKIPDLLETIYESLCIENKLYLLEVIYQNVKELVYKDGNEEESLPEDTIIYLITRFKKRSDLILKTVDTYLTDMEPAEVTILLDILGVLSSSDRRDSHILQRDSSLLINAVFLLKALHMAGKEENNYFTPVQKLSELAINTGQKTDAKGSNDKEDIQNHPAFGFKAGLIRLIGNLVYKHRANQNTLRDTEGISLLLDCCNIDARNPLILQWCIYAIRNLCDGMQKNQEFIASIQKIKYISSNILREMGMTLHQDESGNAVGIMPLPSSPSPSSSSSSLPKWG